MAGAAPGAPEGVAVAGALEYPSRPAWPGRLGRVPPQSFFAVSAVFHYLGPSLAVLLFARVSVLGVAWLRVVTAAVVFAAWRPPWPGAPPLVPARRPGLVPLPAR